ncbi:EAL domain-containing protein [Aestuariirhabdus sp. Z084]|uniref:sensor domain-containing protein n=1 Tax=Aestuariirhabdus haliotis TaxID=2918751 RepID=UPI00201B413A|nr:GGDEF and EAL domain-containing protein [Aestuariirhabdus haliotis]MCL6415560.1 EAL domain-containing protein [Aestuariirhabdus haliotis]MCL6419235.1 EAL domain-containing protein [Aestuariirhabdus haliotis]
MSLTVLQLLAAILLGGVACILVSLRRYLGLVPAYVLLGGITLVHFSPAVAVLSLSGWEAIAAPLSLMTLLLIYLYTGPAAARIGAAIIVSTCVGLPLVETGVGALMGGSLFHGPVVAVPFGQLLLKMFSLVLLALFSLAVFERLLLRIEGIRFWSFSICLLGGTLVDAMVSGLILGGGDWLINKFMVAVLLLIPAAALLLFLPSKKPETIAGLRFWFGGQRKQLHTEEESELQTNTQLGFEARDAYGQLQNILETQLMFAYAVDTDYRYTMFNRAHSELVKQLTGVDPEIGMDILPLLAQAAGGEEIRIGLNQALRGESCHAERRHQLPDGEILVLDASYGPILDDAGNIRGAGACGLDVTEARHTDSALKASEQRWQLALEGSQEGLWDWDIANNQLFLSRRWYEITGYDIDEGFDVKRWQGVLHPDDRARVSRETVGHLRGSDPFYHSEHRIRVAGGDYIWVSERATASFDADGRALRMVGTMADIDASKRAEERTRHSEELLSYAFEVADEGIWDAHIPSGKVFYSPRFLEMLGYTPAEYGDQLSYWGRFVHPEDRALVTSMLERHEENGGRFEERFRMFKKDGSLIYILSRGRVVSWSEAGEPLRMVGIHKDVTQDMERLEQIENLAFYDSLTSLPNRRLLAERAEQSLALARRGNGPLAVLVIDLDKFKDVNDTLGHDVGDLLLVAVSKAIKGCLRDIDTLCRQGGDEFTIILPECSNMAALEVAERIAAAVGKPVALKNHRVQVEASIGIACFPEDGADLNSLLKHADIAMYQAKQKEVPVSLFQLEQAEALERRVQVEQALHEGLESEQIYLEYQPKINLLSGQVIGVEALARWQHPELGEISPVEFVGIAEQSAQIHRLGRRVLELACRQLAYWRAEGINLTMAVNISAQELQNQQLASHMASLLQQHDIDPRLLEIELTETAIMSNIDRSIELLSHIRELGITVAIDDFGTGYSSFSYLNQLPISCIKIDRTFVNQLGKAVTGRGDAETIIRAIVALAHNLDLRVVGEGVETALQQSYLQRLRCDEGQGYLFCRPTSALEISRAVREQRSLLVATGTG